MKRFERDPQSELVRRYARILRSAPAEATRVATPSRARTTAPAGGAPVTPLRRVPAGPDGARSKT
jgi:hypothetical protein